jgi:glycosidase
MLLSCDDSSFERKPSVRRCVLEVRYMPPHFPSNLTVNIGGRELPLSLLNAREGLAGLWGADLWLDPGWVQYDLTIDGRSLPDPTQVLTVEKNGVTQSLFRVPDCTRGRWFKISSPKGRKGDFNLVYERGLSPQQRKEAPNQDELIGVGLDPQRIRVTVDGVEQAVNLEGELLTVKHEYLNEGKHWLRIYANDFDGTMAEVFEAPFWVEDIPHRWTRGLMYQVVLDRLSPPITSPEEAPSIGQRWGGQLDGVTAMIEEGYFDRLGVTSLWLSPLAPNPPGLWAGVEGGIPRYEGYHGYWAAAPRKVGDEWGGEASLKRLVKTAHERGMRLIVDVALNHIHESHPYVEAHPDWFYPPGCLCGRPGCDWGTYIEQCRFTEYLPDFRWVGLEPMVQQVDDALWWIEYYDFDGLRVDAVPMMPRRITQFLSYEAKRRFEGLRTRHLLIGETFTGPKEWSRIGWYIGPNGLDGQFDFPWMWAMREAIAWTAIPMWSLVEVWRAGEAAWSGAAALMGRFVGNHDVTRFVSEAAGSQLNDPWSLPPPQLDDPLALGKLWIATALTFTLPGIPILYYGDESGLAGANDPDNRRPYWPLGADTPLNLSEHRAAHFERVAQLGRLRMCLDAFTDSTPQLKFLANDEERISFMRGKLGHEVIVLIQRGEVAASELAIPLSDFNPNESWVDALSGQAIDIEKKEKSIEYPMRVMLHLPPLDHYDVKIITRFSSYNRCLENQP